MTDVNRLVERQLAWKFNWYRQSELDGSLLLGRMVKFAPDAWTLSHLIGHAAEEAHHSLLWSEVIQKLTLPLIQVQRSYQSFFLLQNRPPTSLLEVLAFTHIFEKRVHITFTRELNDPRTPETARAAYRQMIEDEKGHLGWVAEWLGRQPNARDVLKGYEDIDRQVFNYLEPYRDHLWDLEGLGHEL